MKSKLHFVLAIGMIALLPGQAFSEETTTWVLPAAFSVSPGVPMAISLSTSVLAKSSEKKAQALLKAGPADLQRISKTRTAYNAARNPEKAEAEKLLKRAGHLEGVAELSAIAAVPLTFVTLAVTTGVSLKIEKAKKDADESNTTMPQAAPSVDNASAK